MILLVITSCTIIGTAILCVYLTIKNEKLESEIQKQETEIFKAYNDLSQEVSEINKTSLK